MLVSADERSVQRPDSADTYDAGGGGLASGCQLVLPAPSSGCRDAEYLLACHGGSGVELQDPDPSLGCHGQDAPPVPGRLVYHCCPCH
jgi:hypothetical protein